MKGKRSVSRPARCKTWTRCTTRRYQLNTLEHDLYSAPRSWLSPHAPTLSVSFCFVSQFDNNTFLNPSYKLFLFQSISCQHLSFLLTKPKRSSGLPIMEVNRDLVRLSSVRMMRRFVPSSVSIAALSIHVPSSPSLSKAWRHPACPPQRYSPSRPKRSAPLEMWLPTKSVQYIHSYVDVPARRNRTNTILRVTTTPITEDGGLLCHATLSWKGCTSLQ